MKLTAILATLLVLSVLANFAFAVDQIILLRHAHSSYESYSLFRGCVQTLQKTDTYGTCKTEDGQTIKIVKYDNKWFLDGDLPICWHSICL